MLLKLGRSLKEKDIPMTVLTISRGGVLRKEFEKSGLSVFSLWNLREILRLPRYSHFIGWMYHGNIVASILGKIFEKRVVHNIRQSLQTFSEEKLILKLAIRLNAFFSKSADATIYNSTVAREQHEKMLNYSGRAVHVIPNGFPMFALTGPSQKKNVILNVGRYHRDKDQETFIKAGVKVLEKGAQAEFWLAGRDVDSDNARLTALIPARFLNAFKLLGETQDVQKLYSQASIFVLSSVAEAFPNVLGEAMGSGLLCVTTDVGDAAKILGDDRWVVPSKSPDHIAQKIIELLDLSPAEKENLSKRNHRQIVEKYSMARITDLYLNVF